MTQTKIKCPHWLCMPHLRLMNCSDWLNLWAGSLNRRMDQGMTIIPKDRLQVCQAANRNQRIKIYNRSHLNQSTGSYL